MPLDDMTSWRSARYRTNLPHRAAYHDLVEVSKPTDDCDDRNALYALYVLGILILVSSSCIVLTPNPPRRRNNITVSAQWPSNKSTRQLSVYHNQNSHMVESRLIYRAVLLRRCDV